MINLPQGFVLGPAPAQQPQQGLLNDQQRQYAEYAYSQAQQSPLAQQFPNYPQALVSKLYQESRFDPQAVSPAGAKGIAQFMDGTRPEVGLEDPFDANKSIDASIAYDLINSQRLGEGAPLENIFAAYNAGAGNVQKHGGIPPFEETQNYIQQIFGDKQNEFAQLFEQQQPEQSLPDGFVIGELPVDEVAQGQDNAQALAGQEVATPTFDGNPLLEKALQGATLGFSDEAQSGMRAAFDYLQGLMNGEDVNIGDRYSQYQNEFQEGLQSFGDSNPIASTAAEIAGSIPTAGLGAAKVLSKVPNIANRLTNAAVKGTGLAAAGGAGGAIYGAGTAQQGQRIEGAKEGAISGAVTAPLVGGAAAGISNKIAKSKAKNIVSDAIPSKEQLKGIASDTYKELDNLGVKVSKDAYEDLVSKLRVQAKNAGARPYNSAQIEGALKEMESHIGKDVSLTEIDLLRQAIGGASNPLDPKQSRVAVLLKNTIDDSIEGLDPSKVVKGDGSEAGQLYGKARSLWARSRKADLLDEAVTKAKEQASGFENGLRIQFRSILNNKKKSRGFSPEELKAMRKVVNGSPMGNAAKFLGKFGLSEGQATSMLGAAVGIGGGAAIGGPVGAVAVPLAGQAAKKIASKITQNNAKLANELVRTGKNGKGIVDAYFRNKTQANAKELAALLIDNKADIQKLESAIDTFTGPKRVMLTDALGLISGGGVIQSQDN